MARHPPHRCRIARNPTPVHSALGERLTYRLLQVQRSLSKESQTSAVTCPPQPDNSALRDDQPRPRSLTTTSHPRVSGVLRYAGEHRSGQPAHQYRVHAAAAGSGRALFDGRSRSLSRQCVHQAVFIKRLWRSLKYEAGLPAPVGGRLHGATGDRRVVEFSNEVRPRSALDGRTPAAVYRRVAAPGPQMAQRTWGAGGNCGFRGQRTSGSTIRQGGLSTMSTGSSPPPPHHPPPFTATCF